MEKRENGKLTRVEQNANHEVERLAKLYDKYYKKKVRGGSDLKNVKPTLKAEAMYILYLLKKLDLNEQENQEIIDKNNILQLDNIKENSLSLWILCCELEEKLNGLADESSQDEDTIKK